VSSKKLTPEKPAEEEVKPSPKKSFPWKAAVSWGVTALLVVVLLLVLFQGKLFGQSNDESDLVEYTPTPLNVALPTTQAADVSNLIAVARRPNLNTIVPDGVRSSVVTYTVEAGDSIFSIAKQFNLKPESILWANYDYFGDNPTVALSIGAQLTIPPTDGILYTWKDGDKLQNIAGKYVADESKIISWPSNHLDITDPVITTGSVVMIPGGYREVQSWIQAVEYTPRSGVTRVIAGAGGCQAPDTGPVGSGNIVWPSANHYLSGFDYTSSHRGIDIAAQTGDSVWAADNGTVVYAGWNDTGYGYMVMIDHNDGYQTLYGHLSAVYATCGSSVYQGTVIGAAGATGNVTGAHLHFEVRSNGGFVNPWYVLP
jgi:murein DD-endopeptidase MepM/ murein hydrolase activator NlpD